MIKFNEAKTMSNGYTVYPHQYHSHIFHVMPKGPRIRSGPTGDPVASLYIYRGEVERQGGKMAGGLLLADVEFAIPDADLEQVRAELQDQLNARHGGAANAPKVELATPMYTRGTADISLLGNAEGLVEKVRAPVSPSFYGTMVTPVAVELSAEGAALAEQALRGKGGALQVSYALQTPVRLPEMKAEVWFNAGKFMQFHQEVEIDWSFWGEDDYRESIREQFHSSDSGGVKIDPGAVTDQKVVSAVTDWAWRTLEDAVARIVLGDIPPVSDDARKVPAGIENLTRDISISKTASFHRTFTQGVAYDQPLFLQGTLPSLATLTGKDGQPIRMEDHIHHVDLASDFFDTVRVHVRANADFEQLPIDSVEVKIKYADEPVREYLLRSPEDVCHFEQYTDGRGYEYKYSVQVNYTGESQRYESGELSSDEEYLTINAGKTGVLKVDVLPGDINWDQVAQAQVTLQYGEGDGLVEHALVLDKDNREGQVVDVVFEPVTDPYRFSVKYALTNGKEYTVGPKEGRAEQLHVNDPFSATRTISIRSFAKIDTAFIDLTLLDEEHGYSQTTSVALTKAQPFKDWVVPVIDDRAGTISYSGTIRYQDGSIEDIPQQTTTANTIMIGEAPREIEVAADLVDFSLAKLVKVSLRYKDPTNQLDERRDLMFKDGSPSPVVWAHTFKDEQLPAYTWKAQYFLIEGGSKTVGPETSEDLMLLVPEVPV